MNIYEGTLSLGQVEAFVCEPLEDKTIKPFSRYGDFKTKAHPETGEALTATRAYKNKDVFSKPVESQHRSEQDRWHYIEYQTSDGKNYHYVSSNGYDLFDQYNDDVKEVAKKRKEEEIRQQKLRDLKTGKFREEMADRKTSTEGETHTDTHELGRRDFTSSMRTAQSQTSPQSNEAAKRNFANHMNGTGGSATPQTSSQAHSESNKNGIHR